MRRYMFYLSASMLVVFLGCSSVSVTTDYDREVNFSKYHTYRWMQKKDQGRKKMNSLNEKRIRTAVNRKLGEQGFQKLERGRPDFLVVYHAGSKDKVDVTAYGYHYWRRPRYGYVRVDHYKEGTLIIDVVDPELKQLVWRGIGTGVIDRSNTEDLINTAVEKILDKFPPEN